MNDLIKEGLVLNFNGKPGTICFKTIKDNNMYVNVSFGEVEDYDNMIFKVFLVKDIGSDVDFVEVKDKKLLNELTSSWVADVMIEEEGNNS